MLSVTVGQNPYQSRVSTREEFAPIFTTIVGGPHTDLRLLAVAQRVLGRAGWPRTVLAGRFMFQVGRNERNSTVGDSGAEMQPPASEKSDACQDIKSVGRLAYCLGLAGVGFVLWSHLASDRSMISGIMFLFCMSFYWRQVSSFQRENCWIGQVWRCPAQDANLGLMDKK